MSSEKEWLYNKTNVFADNGLRYRAVTGPMGASVNAQVSFDELRLNTNARIVSCVNSCRGLNPEAVPGLVEACKSVIREAEHSGGWQEEHHKSFHNVAITLTVEEVRAIAAALSAATKGQA